MSKGLARLEKAFVDAMSMRQYCLVVNAANAISGRKHRVAPLREDGLHRVTIGDEQIVICRRARHRRYKRGVLAFSEKLAAEYGLTAIANLSGGSFIDCGANVGELGFWARHHDLHYTAFEPEVLEADCIDLNLFDGAAQTHRIALWNERATLDFFSAPDTADSSVFEIDRSAGRRKVAAFPLDELDLRLSDTGPNILKLEAEGAEPEILDGARATLPRLHYLAVDCGYERGREKRHTFIDVCDRLLPLGFRPVEANLRRVTVLFKNSALV